MSRTASSITTTTITTIQTASSTTTTITNIQTFSSTTTTTIPASNKLNK
jgi:hypothetical protein